MEPLGVLEDLSELDLWGTSITDLRPLAGLTKLSVLDISGTDVADFEPLSSIKHLGRLEASSTLVSDLSSLYKLSALEWLDISQTRVTDLSPLRPLSSLEDRGGIVTFHNTPATASDPRLAEIAENHDGGERTRALFAYLAERESHSIDQALEAALKGPILSESLADLRWRDGAFHAIAMEEGPERPADVRHDELLGALQFTSSRMARADMENRVGREVVEHFRHYAEQSRATPLNPRILHLLGNDIRSVLTDDYLSAGLDGLDLSSLRGFLSEHDAFLSDYYPRVFLGVRQEVKADPVTLQRELLPRLAKAEEAIRAAEILDP